MPSTRERAVTSWTDLPLAAQRVLFADLLSTAGNGIVLPFLAIYAGRVRDLGPAVGAAAVAAIAIGCLPANLVAGSAADRYGARRVLITGWLLAAVGDLFLLRATQAPTVAFAAVLIGLGVGTAYPATSTLLAEVTPPAQRSMVFATQYGLTNIGLSLGIGISAVIVVEPEVSRFQILYALDAVTFLVAAVVLLRSRRPGDRADPDLDLDADTNTNTDAGPRADRGGYRRVVADGAFGWLCLVQLLLVVFGYAQFHAALPLYLSRPDGLAPSMVAAAVLANTCCVALAALPAGRLASRVPPQRLIGMGAVCFAAAWLILSQSRDGSWTSVGIAVAATITLGLGEVLLAAAIGPLVNALSPAELRGRYNALNALVLSLGTIIGPGLVATVFHGSTTDGLWVVLIGGCLTAALLTSARLTPHRIRTGPALASVA